MRGPQSDMIGVLIRRGSEAQREDQVEAQGNGHLQAKEKGSEETQPCRHRAPGPLASEL